MKDIEPYISPLIESQFPSFYREDGTKFITFIKSYYEWLEQSNNILYQTRKLLEYRDIDQTVEEFIVYFKEQTLKNIQFDVATNKRLLAKNALDLYRSKGTERSIDLFFKLVYAEPAKVYYPGDDILKPSDNTWKIPTYLEVSETVYNAAFEGKQITGLSSGATAFVENYAIKKKVNNQVDVDGNAIKISKNIHVFYISNIKGTFRYNEHIVHTGTTDPRNTPKIVGSLNELQVIAGASDYVVGDVVTLSSNTGINGKALVTSIVNTTGQVEFTLIEGGWGYSLSPKIIISEKAIVVNNIVTATTSLQKPFDLFGELVQPKANIEFNSLVGTKFSNNDIVYSYNPDATIRVVQATTNTSAASGNLYVSILSGYTQVGSILYTAGNVSYVTITNYQDRTSTANIMGVSSNNALTVGNVATGRAFRLGEPVYQSNSTVEWANAVVYGIRREGGSLVLDVSNTEGIFVSGETIKGRSSNTTASLQYYSTNLGLFETSEQSVISVTVLNGGTGYSNGQFVTFASNTGGFGAAGVITANSIGGIQQVQVLSRGTGFSAVPTVNVVNSATAVFFNANTDVNANLDFINIPDNKFVNAQAIRYNVTASNTATIGLSAGVVYYARVANSTGVKLSTTPAGNVINLSKGLTQNGHSFTAVVSNGSGADLLAVLGKPFDFDNNLHLYSRTSNVVYFNALSDVNSGSDFITIPNNFFANDQAVLYRVAYGNTALTNLANNKTYYVTEANTVGVKLKYANGTLINLTAGGASQNGHSLSSYTTGNLYLVGEGTLAELRVGSLDDEETVALNADFIRGYNIYGSPYLGIGIYGNNALSGSTALGFPAKPTAGLTKTSVSFNASSDVDGTNDFITLSGHSFTNGQPVLYAVAAGNTALTNLVNNGNYFVNVANSTGVSLKYQSNGSLIDLTSGSSETGHSIVGYTSNDILKDMLQIEQLDVGTITSLTRINPGDDYTLDPFVTIIEPIVAGQKLYDLIITTADSTVGFTQNENIEVIVRKAFDGSSANIISSAIQMAPHPFNDNDQVKYITPTGTPLIGGLANNFTYRVVNSTPTSFKLSLTAGGDPIVLTPTGSVTTHLIENGSYGKFGIITEIIDNTTLRVKRATTYRDIFDNGKTFIRGETSRFVTQALNVVKDLTISGLNSAVEANVVTANGSVKTLKVIDSGYAYAQGDIMSFFRQDDPTAKFGLAKGILEKQGQGTGFYQNTKGFLSYDKYLQDNDFYQDYSYQIISRIPFDRYSLMLKKVLHVAGTKMFPGVDLTAKLDAQIGASRKLEIKTTFNPTSNVDVSNDFIRLPNHLFANGDLVTYSVDDGNTEIKTISAINGIKTISIVSPGSYYNSAVNNQLSITGSDGNGAIAVFVSNSSGNITSVQLLNYGSGYTTTVAPTITAGVANALSTGASFTVSAYTGIGNNVNYYVAYANSTGFKLSLMANGSSIINLVAPLPNETGHGIHRTI